METIGAFLWDQHKISYLLIELEQYDVNVTEFQNPVKIPDKTYKLAAKQLIKKFCRLLNKTHHSHIEYRIYMDSSHALRWNKNNDLSQFIDTELHQEAKSNKVQLADHQIKSKLKGDTLKSFKKFLQKTIYKDKKMKNSVWHLWAIAFHISGKSKLKEKLQKIYKYSICHGKMTMDNKKEFRRLIKECEFSI